MYQLQKNRLLKTLMPLIDKLQLKDMIYVNFLGLLSEKKRVY